MPDLNILIVEDEPLGRERIRSLLEKRDEEFTIAEATDGKQGVECLRKNGYDLVFLDIQMPRMGGFDVIRTIGAANMPPVIFVTAFDEFALKAFEVHALDYLLKPFEPARFNEALDRVLPLIGQDDQNPMDQRLKQLLDQLVPEKEPPLRRIMVKTHQKVEFVRDEDIDWIEAAGNYVQIHEGARTHLLRQTMAQLEKRLDPDRFVRIHRSTIVNLDRVKDLHSMFNGEYEVRLTDGTKLMLSRGYRHILDRFS